MSCGLLELAWRHSPWVGSWSRTVIRPAKWKPLLSPSPLVAVAERYLRAAGAAQKGRKVEDNRTGHRGFTMDPSRAGRRRALPLVSPWLHEPAKPPVSRNPSQASACRSAASRGRCSAAGAPSRGQSQRMQDRHLRHCVPCLEGSANPNPSVVLGHALRQQLLRSLLPPLGFSSPTQGLRAAAQARKGPPQ